MKLAPDDLTSLSEIAIHAANEAAKLITRYSKSEFNIEKKSGRDSLASQVVTEVDRLSQDLILEHLLPTLKTYDLGLLTEESADDHSRLTKDFFWCIDPLDGTLAYTEKRSGYSVSIALVSKEGKPQIGVVVNPVDQTVYHAVIGQGVYINNKKVKLSDIRKENDLFTLIIDHSFLKHPMVETVVNKFEQRIAGLGYKHLQMIEVGGAVMNALGIFEYAPSCYFKFPKEAIGGGCIWDYAATACIYNELGAVAVDFHGQGLNLNSKDSVFMNEKGVIYYLEDEVMGVVLGLYLEIKQ